MRHVEKGRVEQAISLALRALRTRVRPEAMLVVAFEEDVIGLDLLKVEPALRGTGVGTRIMRDVLEIADRFGVPVRLQPYCLAPDGDGLDQEGLEAWYRAFGFAMTGHVSPTGQPIMARAPALPARRRSGARFLREAAP